MTSTDDADARDERLSDAAYERLRAADPAVTAAPDLGALRSKIDDGVGEPGVGVGADGPEDDARVATVPAARRTRPSMRWFQLAAVSVGVLAVGAGGYALGDRAEAPLASAPVEQEGASAPSLGESGAAGSGPAERVAGTQASVSADKMIAPGWGSRTTFDSVGLDDVPTRAHAWAFDASGTFSDATLARLAAALGVSGEPELQYGSWRVGSTDWTGPVVELSPDSQSSFFFTDPGLDPWTEEASGADAPSAETATAQLTDLMATLGVDSAGFEIESPDDMQSPGARSVTAHQVVDGQRTGVRWDLTATTGGIFSVNGQLAPLVDLGEYDVVGARTAVERLDDPRFGSFGGDVIAYSRIEPGAVTDVPSVVDGAETGLLTEEGMAGSDVATAQPVDPVDPAGVPTVPATPVPGATFSWPVRSVTITAAELTTSVYYAPDGAAVLLPSYTVTDASGAQWSTVAVAEAHLDLSPVG